MTFEVCVCMHVCRGMYMSVCQKTTCESPFSLHPVGPKEMHMVGLAGTCYSVFLAPI